MSKKDYIASVLAGFEPAIDSAEFVGKQIRLTASSAAADEYGGAAVGTVIFVADDVPFPYYVDFAPSSDDRDMVCPLSRSEFELVEGLTDKQKFIARQLAQHGEAEDTEGIIGKTVRATEDFSAEVREGTLGVLLAIDAQGMLSYYVDFAPEDDTASLWPMDRAEFEVVEEPVAVEA